MQNQSVGRAVAGLLVIALLLCAGCRDADPVQNGMFHFPKGSRIARDCKAQGKPVPAYDSFSGTYPSKWPKGFELPTGSFVASQPTEKKSPNAGMDMYANMSQIQVRGVVEIEPKELVQYFRDQCGNAGLNIEEDQLIGESISSPYDQQLILTGSGAGITFMSIRIMFEDDLAGFTRYDITIALGQAGR